MLHPPPFFACFGEERVSGERDVIGVWDKLGLKSDLGRLYQKFLQAAN